MADILNALLPGGSGITLEPQPNPYPNLKASDQTLKSDLEGCLTLFAYAIGVEGIETVQQIAQGYITALETTVALVNLKVKFLEPVEKIINTELDAAQSVINEARQIFNKIPVTSEAAACPPLKALLDAGTSIVQGKIHIPGVPVTIDIDTLIQNLRDITSIKVELNFLKEIVLDRIRELSLLVNKLDEVKTYLRNVAVHTPNPTP